MVGNRINKGIAFAGSIILITTLVSGINSASALTPALSSTTNISNGAVDPNIVVKSTNFVIDLNKFAFTVDVGITGLTFDSAAFINSTSVRLNLRGTAQAGSISVQANKSAFYPVADSSSNTLTVTVPDPLIAQTITFDALTSMSVSDSGQILSASSTAGLDVSFSSKTPNTCRIVSQKINPIAAGTCSIKASQTGNSTYQAALDVIRSVVISAAVSGVVEKSVPVVPAVSNFATFQYSPNALNNTYKDLVLSSSGNGQFGLTKLKLFVPNGATESLAAFLVSSYSNDSENDQGFFVVRIGLVNELGKVLNKLGKVYRISMPRGYLYSELYWSDLGTQWQRIPETIKDSLPTDSHAAFFREIDGSVTILTDQLGLFGYRFPQALLEVTSPALKLTMGSQLQVSSVGGTGTGEVTFGTTTSAICTVTPAGVVTGTQAGACFVTARKNASQQYIDSVSQKIVVNIQSSSPVASNIRGTSSVAASNVAVTKGRTTCTAVSYSLTILNGEIQANFCPEDAGYVAVLYLRSASSSKKWVDKEVMRSVIDANGVATFQANLAVRNSDFLHVFVNGKHRL